MTALPRVPGYILGAAIGRNSRATGYEGRSESGGLPVAVWVHDRPSARSDRGVPAARLAALKAVSEHPNVLRVLAGGLTADGLPYLVTAPCPGGSMAALLLRDGPLPLNRVLDVGFEMADALVTAHSFGIVHGDLKPGDIMLDRHGEAQLLLGVASAAPEGVDGAPPTARTDVLGLGVTLYGLLTGHIPDREPTAGEPPSSVEPVLLQPLPPADRPGSEEVMPVLWRATAPDPADRYPDAAALRDGLAAVRAGRPRAAGGIRPSLQTEDDIHRIAGRPPVQGLSRGKTLFSGSQSATASSRRKPVAAATWVVLALLVIAVLAAIGFLI